jgi:hypothetical protein
MVISNNYNSVEAGVLEMADRMRGGRWKAFRGHCRPALESYTEFLFERFAKLVTL